MDAIKRGHQMMEEKVPPLAKEYANFLIRQGGMSADGLFTAFTHYAQYVEGLECPDKDYKIDVTGVRFFEANKDPIEMPTEEVVALIQLLPKKYHQYAQAIEGYELSGGKFRPLIVLDTPEGRLLVSGVLRATSARETGLPTVMVRIINLSKFIQGV